MRSLLFVPADSPRKFEKALACGADALIIDLEDSVAAAGKAAARTLAREALARAATLPGAPKIFVRINALDTGLADADLDAVMPAAPFGIVLPKATGGADVQHLSAKLAVREAENGLTDGAALILPIATETGASMFGLGTYAGASRRLAALTWGAEDLSADLGTETNRDPAGGYTPPFALARSLLLYGAASAEVDAIDTVFTAFRDSAGFEAECRAARRDGFAGKLAIHPDQVAVINAVFTPDPAAVERARAVVAAFAAAPDAGVLSLNGEMIDRPHLRRAQRLLARVG